MRIQIEDAPTTAHRGRTTSDPKRPEAAYRTTFLSGSTGAPLVVSFYPARTGIRAADEWLRRLVVGLLGTLARLPRLPGSMPRPEILPSVGLEAISPRHRSPRASKSPEVYVAVDQRREHRFITFDPNQSDKRGEQL